MSRTLHSGAKYSTSCHRTFTNMNYRKAEMAATEEMTENNIHPRNRMKALSRILNAWDDYMISALDEYPWKR
jgi:hypothetical protein